MIRTRTLHPRVPGVTLLAGSLVVALLYVAGCDTLGEPGTLTLTVEEDQDQFDFRIRGDQLQAGTPTDIPADDVVNLTNELAAFGYQPADVLTARVASATIDFFQRGSADLQSFSSVQLLFKSGGSEVVVATLPAGEPGPRTALTVASGASVTPFLRQPTFQLVLRVTPRTVIGQQTTYGFNVDFALSVEVEGV